MSQDSGQGGRDDGREALAQRRRRAVRTALIVAAVAVAIYAFSLYKAFSGG